MHTRWYVAVITIVGFLIDGEYRDVTISWRTVFFHFLVQYKGVKAIFMSFLWHLLSAD